MSKIGLVALLFLTAGRGYAQQDYFVLIKTDNNQPFYARIGGKPFSSSAQGHLIIPQLRDSTYLITIGFPKKLFPEQDFPFTINKSDLEFQLKDLGEKGWGLFNTRSMELKMPVRIDTAETKFRPEGVRKDDAFSRLMAEVVSDTDVMYNTYAREQAKKDTMVKALSTTLTSATPSQTFVPPAPPPEKRDSSLRASPAGMNNVSDSLSRVAMQAPDHRTKMDSAAAIPVAAMPNPVSTAPGSSGGTASPGVTASAGGAALPAVVPPGGNTSTGGAGTAHSAGFVPKAANRHKGVFIEKISEQKGPSTLVLTYADHILGRPTDTILIMIPVDSGSRLSSRASLSPEKAADTLKKGTVPLVVSAGAGTELSKGGAETGQKNRKAAPAVVNSDCKSFAADYDVDKLRLKLLASPRDEDKVLIAKKVFKTKCFTTAQVRALCEVFTADAGKFRFLEAAYPFVSDDHFRQLSDILTDLVYISRFRMMTGQ